MFYTAARPRGCHARGVEKDREAEEERAGPGLRCPFCHDALDGGDPVVTCARCDAPQHAACSVEGRGCAATGCGWTRVVLGGARDVDLAELERLAADPAELRRLVVPPSWPAVVHAVVLAGQGLLVLTLLAAGLTGALDPCTAVAAAIGALGLGAIVRVFATPPRRRRRETDHERQQSWAAAGVAFMPNPAAPLLDELRASPVLPRPPAAALPETCPHCRRSLGRPDDEDATSFCHHCGGWVGPGPAPDGKKA